MDKPTRIIGPYELWGNGLKDSWMVRDTRVNRVVLSGMTRQWSEQWMLEHVTTAPTPYPVRR